MGIIIYFDYKKKPFKKKALLFYFRDEEIKTSAFISQSLRHSKSQNGSQNCNVKSLSYLPHHSILCRKRRKRMQGTGQVEGRGEEL